MENIFGISITSIMVVVVSIMSLCLLSTALIAWRSPVVFRMALRNIPRRRAQSILIMVGLMLSTMIISAALTTGDSLDNSFKQSAYNSLGEVDQTIAVSSDGAGEGNVSVLNPTIPVAVADALAAQLVDDPHVAAIMPVLTVSAPVVNNAPGLSEPAAIISGIDPARLDGFGGFTGTDGQPLDFANLPVGSTVVSQDLASAINASTGDQLTFYYDNQPHTLTVAGIVQGSILTGYATQTGQAGPSQTESSRLVGLAVPLAWLQDVTGLEGQARFIAVSNAGGVESGLQHSDNAVATLQQALAAIDGGQQLGVNPIKQNAVEGAELLGNTFMTFFVILGMFSISAGVLLIFLIFMMLAAERRSEMGMARAVGMKRRHLIQGFIAEGTTYALGAGLIGALLGVGTAALMVTLISAMSADNVTIGTHVTAQSLVVAFALGMTITFITVVFASVRSSRLNIVAAIRDLQDDAQADRGRRPAWHWLPATSRIGSSRLALLVSQVLSIALIVPRLAIWSLRVLAHMTGWGPLIAVIGAVLTGTGVLTTTMLIFATGLSLLVLGLALFLSRYLPARAVYTVASTIMLLYWLLPMSMTQRVLPNVGDGEEEMFFASGVFMVAYSTMLIIWNADVLVRLVSVFGNSFARWLPAVKTAIAYPLASKSRTGLTVAMFSMVIFSLVTVRTLSGNFSATLLSDDARAGWDIVVLSSPTNPIDNLQAELAAQGVNLDQIGATGQVHSLDVETSQVRNLGYSTWKRLPLHGADADFIAATQAGMEARAPGYATDEAVWDALASGERVAVIDMLALDGGEFGGNPDQFTVPEGVEIVDGALPDISVEIRDPRSGRIETLPVIGVIDSSASTLTGLYMPEALHQDMFGTPDFSQTYLQLSGTTSTSAVDLAREVEAALQPYGVQADALQEQIEEQQTAASSFFVMLQGFMGLGMLVGIAALGVISFRSVVERRQQIGMLRAIGYRRSTVAASFMLESLVIAAFGVISGTLMAVILSYNLIMDGGMGTQFDRFVIPWTTILGFIALSLVAAAVMTWIPARKAASVPIAEALRYE